MKTTVKQVADVGRLIRLARKAQGMRQDDVARCIGVSENFLGKVERGSGGVHWGKLFQVLQGLGVEVTLEFQEATPSHAAEACDGS